jgi:hypothetical protein
MKNTSDRCALGHTVVTVQGRPATALANGLTDGKKCSVCDAVVVEQQVIPKTNCPGDGVLHHKGNCEAVTVKVVEATCSSLGFTVYKCSVCGCVFADDFVPAEEDAHNMLIVDKQDPTCTSDGFVKYECAYCGTEATITTPKSGHISADAVVENPVVPGCVTQGSYDTVIYCTVCRGEISRVTTTITPSGHNEIDIPGTSATCTTDGLTAGKKCTKCNTFTVPVTTIPALGHTNTETVMVEPGCTTPGVKHVKCTVCGVESTEIIQPTGHIYPDTPDEIVNPTCTNMGYKTYHCTGCGYEYLRMIDVLPHEYGADGKCTVCGKEE